MNATPINNMAFSNTNPKGLILAELREAAFNMGYTAGRNDVIEKVRSELVRFYDEGGLSTDIDTFGCEVCRGQNKGSCKAEGQGKCPVTTAECVDAYLAELLKEVCR